MNFYSNFFAIVEREQGNYTLYTIHPCGVCATRRPKMYSDSVFRYFALYVYKCSTGRSVALRPVWCEYKSVVCLFPEVAPRAAAAVGELGVIVIGLAVACAGTGLLA